MWGLVWAIGYAGTEFFPAIAGKLWLVLDALGAAGSFLIARAAYDPAVRATRSVNFLVLLLGFIAFWGATFYILQPRTGAQAGAFPALWMAFVGGGALLLSGAWMRRV